MIQQLNSNAQVFVLGAPNESEKVNEICKKSDAVPAICELDEAYSLLCKADLLISGDTSIKHLASATAVKIIEISIGSSEYTKTGVYKDNSVILQGLAPCAPCSHRAACHQPSHLCGEKITAELISMVAIAKLRNDDASLRLLAHEFRDEVLVLKTKINKNGDWSAIPLGKDFTNQEINSWVDRASFKLLMQKAYDKPIGEFGTEGVEIRQILETIYPDRQKYEWVEELSHLERDLLWFEGQIEGFLAKLKTTLSQYQQEGVLDKFYSEITDFFERSSGTFAFESYCHMMKLNGLNVTRHDEPFTAIKKLREQLVQAHQRSKIELKLIRGLQTDFMEGP